MSFRSLRGVAALLTALTTSACISTISCPEGTAASEGGRCAAPDAGAGDGATGDVHLPLGDASLVARDAPDAGRLDVSPDACPLTAFYPDGDGDGAGDGPALMACAAPPGYAPQASDCDDGDPTVHPGAAERCDMAMTDENCSGTANEGCECYVGPARASPGESDVGECVAGSQTCDETGHWDPACTGTLRARTELCDNLDNDCDGAIDGGAASAACPPVVNGRADCSFGTCNEICNAGHVSCSSAPGCETTLGTRAACTGCGDACSWACGSVTSGCADPVILGLSETGLLSTHTSCAIRSGGALYCWGNNESGQVGNGATSDATRPVPVTGLTGRVLDVAAGPRHACAVFSGGRVYCWGDNSEGQLGNDTTTSSTSPVEVLGITDARAVVSGLDFSCALLTPGTVQCWGANANRQLGVDDVTRRLRPVSVLGVSDASDLEAGRFRACAVTGSGVVCWGDGRTGRVTTSIPGRTATRVAVGANHTCALAFGDVYCWGGNEYGEIGNGTVVAATSPVRVGSWRGGLAGVAYATDIAAGSDHTCAVGSDGGLSCWGRNTVGQVGNRTTTNATSPVLLTDVSQVIDVDAGGAYTCALSRPRTAAAGAPTPPTSMTCWGENEGGELGNMSTADSNRPVAVALPL